MFRYNCYIGQTIKKLFASNTVQDATNLNMNEYGVYIGERRGPSFEVAVIQTQSRTEQSQELVLFQLSLAFLYIIFLTVNQ